MRILSQEDVRQQSLPLQQFIQTLGSEVDYYALRQLFWRFGSGNFTHLPLVCVCLREDLNGAPSGYDAAGETIFLAEDFVNGRSQAQIVAALMQEVLSVLIVRATRMGQQMGGSFLESSFLEDTH
ncbi:MAG: hypothetical protein AAF703_14325 [Cyanobacteria bacterium P01_D01_bin.105]